MKINKGFFDFFKNYDMKEVAKCVLNLSEYEKNIILSIWGENAYSSYNDEAREIIIKLRKSLAKDFYEELKLNALRVKFSSLYRLQNMAKYKTLLNTYDKYTSLAIMICLNLDEEINEDEFFIITGKNKKDIYEIIRNNDAIIWGLSHRKYDKILGRDYESSKRFL